MVSTKKSLQVITILKEVLIMKNTGFCLLAASKFVRYAPKCKPVFMVIFVWTLMSYNCDDANFTLAKSLDPARLVMPIIFKGAFNYFLP